MRDFYAPAYLTPKIASHYIKVSMSLAEVCPKW